VDGEGFWAGSGFQNATLCNEVESYHYVRGIVGGCGRAFPWDGEDRWNPSQCDDWTELRVMGSYPEVERVNIYTELQTIGVYQGDAVWNDCWSIFQPFNAVHPDGYGYNNSWPTAWYFITQGKNMNTSQQCGLTLPPGGVEGEDEFADHFIRTIALDPDERSAAYGENSFECTQNLGDEFTDSAECRSQCPTCVGQTGNNNGAIWTPVTCCETGWGGEDTGGMYCEIGGAYYPYSDNTLFYYGDCNISSTVNTQITSCYADYGVWNYGNTSRILDYQGKFRYCTNCPELSGCYRGDDVTSSVYHDPSV
jgi:hypothetical protein